MKLQELVEPGAIVLPLASTERDAVLAELVDALVQAGAVERSARDDLLKRIVERERRATTGFGMGVAVPHAKLAGVKRIRVAVGLSSRGIDFTSMDHQPVYIVAMLVSPSDRPEEHLQAMEAIFTCLNQDSFRRSLRQATSSAAVMDLIRRADASPAGA